MKQKKSKGEGGRGFEQERVGVWGVFFFLFVSFSNLRKSDRRFSSGLKAKLIYAMRATHGHQNLGVSSNSMR